MKLGGFVCVRNVLNLDYCWREAVQSLLPICDEVVICDSDSEDGTSEIIRDWAHKEAKLTICNFPWTDPKGDNTWYPTWLNTAREHLKMKDGWCIYLDADEILHETSYPMVRWAAEKQKALVCERFNFWRDPQHLIPKGVCLGWEVIRVGPQRLFFPSDYPDPRAAEIMRIAQRIGKVEIMHYGFLRRREAFFRKARAVQRIWGGDSYDPRLEAAEIYDGEWACTPGITGWENKLDPFHGTHPSVIRPWLTERGYTL